MVFKPQSGIRKCIWCGSTKRMEAEHIIGNWVRKVIKRNPHRTHLTVNWSKQTEKGMPDIIAETVQGDAGTMTNPRVCWACNHGWLRDLQDTAKPVIAPLMKGDWSDFGQDVVPAISNWMLMTSITLSNMFAETLISQDTRSRFMSERSAWNRWAIFVGRMTGNQGVGYMQRTAAVFDIFANKEEQFEIVTLELGQLLIQAIYSPSLPASLDFFGGSVEYAHRLGIIPIFPQLGDGWIMLPFLREFDLLNAANHIWLGGRNMYDRSGKLITAFS